MIEALLGTGVFVMFLIGILLLAALWGGVFDVDDK